MASLVTFSVRRNLQLEEGQVNSLLLRRHLQGGDGYLGNHLTEEKPVVGEGSGPSG
jgi:hypothetical protein